MYYFYNGNNFSKEYLPFKKFRFCIENILNLNIHFKNLNEVQTNDTLIIFSYDIYNPVNILDKLLNKNYKILIINTENYLFHNIANMFRNIINKKNIYLIEYNVVNINLIKNDYKNINLKFLPLLYNPCLENFYKEKFIPYLQRKNDVLFCGSIGGRRRGLLNKISNKFNIKTIHSPTNLKMYNTELANSKIILNIYYYEHNKIFDYYRNSYLLSNKCLIISEYPENIDLTIEKNLIGYEENLIFFKKYDDLVNILEKYIHLSEEEYKSIVNKQYEWFKKQNNMKDYAQEFLI